MIYDITVIPCSWSKDPSASQGGQSLILSKGWCVMVCLGMCQYIQVCNEYIPVYTEFTQYMISSVFFTRDSMIRCNLRGGCMPSYLDLRNQPQSVEKFRFHRYFTYLSQVVCTMFEKVRVVQKTQKYYGVIGFVHSWYILAFTSMRTGVLVCTSMYRQPVCTGTARYIPKRLFSSRWSGFQIIIAIIVKNAN
jgi:hypothetical protein